MTGEKYKDVDVPFCVLCSRFMMIYIGEIWIALAHEKDEEAWIRSGKVYKCPQCGHSVVYKWTLFPMKSSMEKIKECPYWLIFLEDHTHYNKHQAKK